MTYFYIRTFCFYFFLQISYNIMSQRFVVQLADRVQLIEKAISNSNGGVSLSTPSPIDTEAVDSVKTELDASIASTKKTLVELVAGVESSLISKMASIDVSSKVDDLSSRVESLDTSCGVEDVAAKLDALIARVDALESSVNLDELVVRVNAIEKLLVAGDEEINDVDTE
jgi:hypothetical protein